MFDDTVLNIGIYCSSTDWNWPEQHALEYGTWLNERGAKVVLFCVDESPLYRGAKNGRLRVERVQKNKKYGDSRNARKVAVKYENNKLDVIWICDNWDISLAGNVKSMANRKLLLLYQQNRNIGSNKRDFVHSRRYGKIDFWVTPLNYLVEEVKKKTRFQEDKIHLIPTAVDIQNMMYHNLSKEQARFELNLEPTVQIMGVAGRISPRRGQLFLATVLPELRRKHAQLELLIYGSKGQGEAEAYYEDLIDTIERYRLEKVVHIREQAENPAVFYKAIDYFVGANKMETSGIETIMAMLFGNKIIGTNTGGVPELLEWGEYGELYSPDNLFEFSQAFESMQADELRTDQKARSAAMMSKDRHDHYFACDVIEALLKDGLKKLNI
ncbi:glycosyltransferase family 4 protein [Crocinitomix catalasitica]|nr:glycosyltransferase family 4 protein [Crocinitomix catalasitica]